MTEQVDLVRAQKEESQRMPSIGDTSTFPSMTFYGLLHVIQDEKRHMKAAAYGPDPIDTYLLCAALCSASMKAGGEKFALITNSSSTLRERCKRLEIVDLDIIQYEFGLSVPRDSPFYSAHFKLELLSAFGTGAFGSRVGLDDIDTVLHKPFALDELRSGNLVCYDISDQDWAYHGRERVTQSLNLIAGQELKEPRWYGGEFLAGTASDYFALAHFVERCWPRYVNHISRVHHVGDETVTSVAINLLRESGHKITDAGRPGGVVRWWSALTSYRQLPFSDAISSSLLHLPGDKRFLASQAARSFEGEAFVDSYRRNFRSYLLRRAAKKCASLIGGGPALRLPKL